MAQREQIGRGRLRAQIHVQALHADEACVFCPREVAEALHRYLVAKSIVVSLPLGAIFGRYPTDQLIVTLSVDKTSKEVTQFVDSLPEVCYERDVLHEKT